MTNSPEMVVAILALAKLGVVVDLINTNHRGEYSKNRSTFIDTDFFVGISLTYL